MSIENLEKPIAAAELMKGNNFWLRLKSIVNTPRNMLAIEYTVNAGGGARGKRPELFVILNVSKDRDSLSHLNGQVLSSPLVQSTPVHESVLKNILSLAKKGDRKLVDIGNGLILGQIDLMKVTFPNIFQPQTTSQNHTPQTDEDNTMSNGATIITWENLFRNISDIIEAKAANPIRLQDVPNNIGVLAINVKGASPVARFETSFSSFRSIQKALEVKLTKLTPGQYVRVEFASHKENIFIGDMQALLGLRPLAGQDAETRQAAQSGKISSPPPAPEASALSESIETTTPPATPAEAVTEPTPKTERKVRWTIFYTQFGSVNKELETDKISNQYGVIEYKDSDKGLINLGLFVTIELCKKLGIKINEDSFQKFPSSEIMSENIPARAALEKNQAIAILKFRKIHTLIFPMNGIPEVLINHMKLQLSDNQQTEATASQGNSNTFAQQVAQAIEVAKVPVPPTVTSSSPAPKELSATFEIASGTAMAIPNDLAQRISQRKGENEVLARIEDVRKILSDANMVSEIRWNGVELRLTSNPVLLNNIPALADYFALQVQHIAEEVDKEPNISWVSAFEKAASHDGLVVFKPNEKEPLVLITKIPDFFANITREFC